MTRRIGLLLITVCVFLGFPSLSRATQPLTGCWTGHIALPSGEMGITVQFNHQDGVWTGDITIPAQNARNLPLEKIGFRESRWTWIISSVPGNPVFSGDLSPDGKELKGEFSQNGARFSFILHKSTDPAQTSLESLDGLEELISRGLRELEVPGLALAIVRDGKVLLSKGYGLRDVEKQLPMTADTLLAIGSSSKAFTTLTLGTLVDQGLLDWDKPLRRYIPWFTLYDRPASERFTPRDLVTHRSGLPRHDLVWYNNNRISREELVKRLAYLEPTADLRTRFQYNNLMFLSAGYLLETLSGQTWEEAVRQKVFIPLGMNRSNCSVSTSQGDPDHALPYTVREHKIIPIPFRNIDVVGPAGAINSSAREMSRWLLLNLGRGIVDGQKIINYSTLSDLHTPQMTMDGGSTDPMIESVGYAMGWFVDSYRGHRRIQHGGAIDGFICQVSFLPREGIGVVALANMNGTPLPELLVRTVCDMLLKLEPRDWIAEAAKRRATGMKAGEEAQKRGKSRRVPKTKPAHELNQYGGIYHHPGYGDIRVSLSGRELSFQYNGITTPLEHWHFDTFSGLQGEDPTFEDFKLNFGTDIHGRIAWLEAQMESSLDPIRFRKTADPRFFDPSFLKNLVGRYEMPGQTITIILKGDSLVAVLPGQPELDLIPAPGDEFSVRQVKAISMRFLCEPEKKAHSLEIFQGGRLYVAKRTAE